MTTAIRNVNSDLSHSEYEGLGYILKVCSHCFRSLHFGNPVPLCQSHGYISHTICVFIAFPSLEVVNAMEHLKVVATITNTGNETLKVLNDSRAPLNRVPTNTFVINDLKGVQLLFMGINLKFVPDTMANVGAYTTLTPDKSVAIERDCRCHLRTPAWFVAHIIFSPPSHSYVQFYCLWSSKLRYLRKRSLLCHQCRLYSIDSADSRAKAKLHSTSISGKLAGAPS